MTIRILLAALAAVLLAAPALAHETRIGKLVIEHPYARASAGPAKTGAAYLTVRNEGEADDRLVAVSCGAAMHAQLHGHVNDGGVMRMRHLADGIAVPAGGEARLAPGGHHIMLMGLNGPLFEGETIQIELTFKKAGAVTVEVEVEGVAAGAHGSHKTH
jgi:hypothetical protein